MIKKLSKFSKKELDAFFQSATSALKSQAFTILTNQTSHKHGKLLVIVSKKYGNAPARNLIKRRFKSIFREEKLYEKTQNVIIIPRAKAKTLSFQELRQILLKALK